METEARDLHAEVAQIFTSAGWKAGESFDWDNKFAAPNLLAVGGIDPWGTPRTRAVRGEITDEAAWLVEHAKQFAPVLLETPATLEPITLAQEPEQVETPGHDDVRSDNRDGDAEASVWSGDHAPEDETGAESVLGATGDGSSEHGGEGDAFDAVGLAEGDAASVQQPLDADFTIEDLGSEDLLADADFDTLALEGADLPEEPQPEHPSGAFIFGDNLAHDRIVRIGQLAEIANTLIDATKAGYNESEHNAVRSHVVMNMNESGAYIGGDQGLFDRFLELDAITSKVRQIEAYRDAQQDYIRSADRDMVALFDPSAGWP